MYHKNLPFTQNRFVQGSQYSMSDLRKTPPSSRGCLFTNFEDVQLTDEERVYLNAAALGDAGVVRQSLEESESGLNVNCVDYMGRNALHLAVDCEDMEIIELLLDKLNFDCIEEALLHAISKGCTKIVKVITEHPSYIAGEDKFKKVGVKDAFFRTEEKSQFSPDITPLILAAHYNNHEIVQMFLSRSHTIEKPHVISCDCTDCVTKQNYDSLKRSRSRLNAYRALASPAYMALSSPDPIMTTFGLRQEMMKLSEVEKEFKKEYLTLVEECMNFACEMMDLCRGTQEVEAVLSESNIDGNGKRRDPLGRLKMAIRYEEKKFVAHPNCQQHLTNIWYGPEMAFLQSANLLKKISFFFVFVPIVPFLCLAYLFAPNSKLGSWMRCPVTKFITHTISHLCFLVLLAAATFRLEEKYFPITTTMDFHSERYGHLSQREKTESLMKETLRPASTLITHVQICIMFWILGLLWSECKQIYSSGVRDYVYDYYNFMDFTILSLYLASYAMRFIVDHWVKEADHHFNATSRAREALLNMNYTYFNNLLIGIRSPVNADMNYFMEASRFTWKANDPEIISDILFAVANVFSFARTTYLMPAFEVLGPLQISFARMIGDITRFMVLFILVLFAFMVGLHNLYWYYGTQEIRVNVDDGTKSMIPASEAFEGLKHTLYSLFWSMFGQVPISSIPVRHPQARHGVNESSQDQVEPKYNDGMPDTLSSTYIVEAVGMFLFAIYHVIITIVLVNMLIAMMSHSFEDIQGDCDVEWKFARTKLWMNYIEDGSTLPAPFNMVPTPKSCRYAYIFIRRFCSPSVDNLLEHDKARNQTFIRRRRENVCKTMDIEALDTSYSDIMQRLVRRYLFKLEREQDGDGITERVKDGINIRAEDVVEAQEYPAGPGPSTIYEEDEEDFRDLRKIPDADADEKDRRPPGFLTPDAGSQGLGGGFTRKPSTRRSTVHRRRSSLNGQQPSVQVLSIPQLDAIQRTQKLLDVRLQHLQSTSDAAGVQAANQKVQNDLEHIHTLLSENQKAMYSIVKAVSTIQEEIHGLVYNLGQWFSAQNELSTHNRHEDASNKLNDRISDSRL
ncbi:short transient receptor potential channel 7-like [Tubulanus polymorphus]|uniref:short transient receptor potential channel 7-like n=1 Tax=Tubulanus polymorphus TaxID=672921 RepID=UPI003DA65341